MENNTQKKTQKKESKKKSKKITWLFFRFFQMDVAIVNEYWFWSASAGVIGNEAKSTHACEVRAGKNLKVRFVCVRRKICRTLTLWKQQ